MAAIAVAVISCSAPTETVITGIFGEDAPAEVKVLAGDIDTTLTVENGTFTIAVPASKAHAADIRYNRVRTVVIPDCEAVELDFTGEKLNVVPSDKKSLNTKLRAALDFSDTFIRENNGKIQELMTSGAAEDEVEQFIDSVQNILNDYYNTLLDENKDNYLSAYALYYVSSDKEPAELLDIIGGLSEEVQNEPSVAAIKTVQESMLNTVEGKMFTDFTVNSVVGMTRSIPPQYKYADVMLSDYVGKGKYVLVDFWASWCGPCKREIPNLKAVYDKYHGEEFDMLSVAVWDETEASLKAAEELGMNWNHIVNAQNIPTDLYGIQGIPHIILFGPDGTILKRDLRGEAIGEAIAKYIQK